MGKLGQAVAKAHKLAAPSMGHLAIMITRQHGSLTMIAYHANKLEEAAKILRQAIEDS